ncbi:hypothetical protein QBC38DRAFT_486253 [Podospora fimiseda]|uniref:Uncharacterized protein n=1 Tax=Podospora fimiseda TaxID=252190 RepID=A0AAN7GZD8_9PEZI|nr:hypothetical protein QBC38DRAFT_486253 [Podospora fimiseda]
MKNWGFATLSGTALLQLASAACCRSNRCLNAVISAPAGLADCSANLVVTVTPSATALTETLTVVESAIETILFTEILTETAAIETLLFTDVTTVTASTQTNIVSETVTVPVHVTTTIVESATPVITTAFVYPNSQTLVARQVDSTSSIPEYVTQVCADWEKYIKACGCAGIKPAIITASLLTETITVTASNAITTTLSSTQTDTVTVTETTSATTTNIDSVIETTTTTETLTASQTTTISTTSTPTSIVSVQCQSPGISFRASTPFWDGSTRWMNVVNSNIVAWQSFANGVPVVNAPTATWVMDNDGYLELRNIIAGQSEVLVAVMATASTGESAQVIVRGKSIANAQIAAGTHVRVKACVTAEGNELRIQARGKNNVLECGNGLYLSSGVTGKDIRSDCHLLTPTVIR